MRSALTTSSLAITVLFALHLGCESSTPSADDADGGPTPPQDASPRCTSDLECDDGEFCSGVERCMAGACADGAPPCAAASCDETRDQCATPCAVPDADEDGFDAIVCGGGDCDDGDANRFPGNPEICDIAGKDEDCDPRTFGFRDSDGDGTGDARCCSDDGTTRACGADCDDANASIRPGQVEVCNGLDEDCDLVIDEGATRTFWPDLDFDGFGDGSATSTSGCAPPASGTWVENAGDCDDGAFFVAPSSPEICNAIDDDCDRATDEAAAADRSCEAPNGVFACVEGRCARVGCADPFADCDADAATGCETDVRTSTAHCGACGNACGAGGTCVDRSCDRVVGIAAGRWHTCALRERGAVVCFGDNSRGQLGDGSRSDRLRPTPVIGLVPARTIALGFVHTCAASADGWVYCWGNNELAELGDGGTVDRAIPGPVAGLDGEVDTTTRLWSGPVSQASSTGGRRYISAGYDGVGVRAWGVNSSGQLGDRTIDTRLRPVEVAHLRWRNAVELQTLRVDSIAYGDRHVCVGGGFRQPFTAMERDAVICWGTNDDGQLGNASLSPSTTAPVFASFAGDVVLSGPVQLAAGFRFTCALSGGNAYCWGSNTSGQLGIGATVTRGAAPALVSGITEASAICAGAVHACVLRAGGVRCWGGNNAGQLGDGTTTTRRSPVDVVGLSDATAIACGGEHTCALRATGQVVCWGLNGDGQLGDGTRDRRLMPTPVAF